MAAGRIKRHTKTLSDGTITTYSYQEQADGTWKQIGKVIEALGNGPARKPVYRNAELKQILQACEQQESLLVVGEAGSGKSFLAEEVFVALKQGGYTVAIVRTDNPKACLVSIAEQLGVDTHDGQRHLTIERLKVAIQESLVESAGRLVCDDVHRWPKSLRLWLEQLHHQQVSLVIFATNPPAADIFLALPRLKLRAMEDSHIRAIMATEAQSLGMSPTDADLAFWAQSCGGNPLLARRRVKQEFLGLKEEAPDHQHWVDGTPFLIAALLILTLTRVVGIAAGSSTLYILGGIITVAVALGRLLLYSLPRKGRRLG